MSSSETNDDDYIIVRGEQQPLKRAEMQHEIARASREHNLTPEQAWERVKDDVRLFLEQGKLRSDDPEPKGGFTLEMSPTKELVTTSSKEAKPADNETDVDPNLLSDDLLPPHLRNSGMSVIEAISKGLISVKGEHPDVPILRQAYNEKTMFGASGDLQKPASKAVVERQLYFPFKVPQDVRIMSTDFNQTSLFHVASNNTERRFYKMTRMGSIGENVSLYYNGEELRHDDEAIVLQLIHLARGKAPGEYIEFKHVGFHRGAKGSKRKLSADDIDAINKSLERMRGGYVMVKNAKRNSFITLNLIRDLQGQGNMRRVMLDPAFIALLDSFITMDQNVLYEMRGVARQLYKYISTKPFNKIYPTKITSLFELCYGSIEGLTAHYREKNPSKTPQQVNVAMTKKLSDFKRTTLKDELKKMQDRGLIAAFDIDYESNKVVIVKRSADDEGGA